MFDKKLNEGKLNEMSFLDYLKWLQENIAHLSYSKGTSASYWEAREIIQNLIKRYMKEFGLSSVNFHNHEIGGLLRSTEIELDDYSKYAKTDKAKAEVIATFKSDIESDLTRLIYDCENKNV